MNLETIRYEESGPLAVATMTRPEAMNALNARVLSDLGTLLSQVAENKSLRVLILTGAGEKAFVAGADIKEIDALDDPGAFARRGQDLFGRMEALEIPVIAAVNGFALGGGLELALACDFIVASRSARFGLPECTLGIMPGYGGTVRLLRRIGPARAKEVAMTGGFYTAEQGMAMGFVNRVVEPAQLMAEARELALVIASRAPLAVSAIKRSMQDGMDMALEAHLELEAELFAGLFGSVDQIEGTKAFIEKRKPIFTGK